MYLDGAAAQRIVVEPPAAHPFDGRQQLVVVTLVADRVDGGGIDDEQRRRVELVEEARVGLVEPLEIAAIDVLLVGWRNTANSKCCDAASVNGAVSYGEYCVADARTSYVPAASAVNPNLPTASVIVVRAPPFANNSTFAPVIGAPEVSLMTVPVIAPSSAAKAGVASATSAAAAKQKAA